MDKKEERRNIFAKLKKPSFKQIISAIPAYSDIKVVTTSNLAFDHAHFNKTNLLIKVYGDGLAMMGILEDAFQTKFDELMGKSRDFLVEEHSIDTDECKNHLQICLLINKFASTKRGAKKEPSPLISLDMVMTLV